MTKESSTARVKEMITLLRDEHVTWSHLTVGDVMIEGAADLKLAEKLPKPKDVQPERRQSMFEKYGGQIAQHMTTSEGLETTVIEEDEE